MLTLDSSFIRSGGDLVIEDCRLCYFRSKYYGAAVYCEGGTARIKNTTIEDCESMYGSAVTVNGGAKVDMLNCSVIACKSRTGSIHNIYGELNIVNSEITFGDVYQYYERNGGALTANRVTRAVNSILFFRVGNDQFPSFATSSVAGDVELYGCTFDSLNGEVTTDEKCEALGELTKLLDRAPFYVETRGFYDNEINLHTMINLKPEYRQKGNVVSVENGKLVYTDGKSVYQTGVEAAFDENDYAYDILGNKRSYAYGCCSDLTKTGFIRTVGDVNYDGVISIRDVTAIQRHLAELELFTDEQLELADVNGDGEVDIADATHLQKYLAEYDVFLG